MDDGRKPFRPYASTRTVVAPGARARFAATQAMEKAIMTRNRIEVFDEPSPEDMAMADRMVRSVALLCACLSLKGPVKDDFILDRAQEFEDFINQGRED